MNGEQNQKNLIATTDCLEAVGVFRGWKNGLFFLIIFILLLLQISFWLVHSGLIKSKVCEPETPPIAKKQIQEISEDQAVINSQETDKISDAAKQVASEPNQLITNTTENQELQKSQAKLLNINTDHLSCLIRFLNFVLILTTILYCLTMLFILKVSLQGRMGGINHITRAFFLSILMLVLLLPWQQLFKGIIVGVMYTPFELINACENFKTSEIVGKILFYLRFCVYWFVTILLLILSQVRSARWAKATLRRLDVV
ncbi:MAG: hypothetical protein ACYSSP_13130 [Planctomycetota bacterium]|jgi:hypothetical protein